MAENVASEDKAPLLFIPPSERKFPNEVVRGSVAQLQEALEQKRRVRNRREPRVGNADQSAEFTAIVETNIGDEFVLTARDWAVVEPVLRKNLIEVATKAKNFIVGAGGQAAVGTLGF